MDKSFTSYQIEERSYVSYIKREIHNQVARARFSESKAGEIDIIVSEITSNIIKHAGKGELLYRIQTDKEDLLFEIISIDKGPGMTDTARMMKDGVSTTNTLGQGLGAIVRLSNLAQVYSLPGWGTVLYSIVKSKEDKTFRGKDLSVDLRALCIPKPREVVCGDGYRIRKTESEVMIFFGDGLGHGVHAKTAVDQAGDYFMECTERDPVDIIRQMHEHSRRTRGLVASIAICNLKINEWRICGVGNIFTRMYTGIQFKNCMPYNGTVGQNLPNSMNSTVFPCEKNQHLIMCSDGIQTRWDLTKYPAIFKYDNSILAATLYKDFSRGNDDASVLIAKVTQV